MLPSEVKHYEVTLGDKFVSNLKEQTTSKQQDRNNGFAIRYSVATDNLKTDKSTVSLRKNARGEYIIEQGGDGAVSGSSDHSNNATAGPVSFRGTGTQTRDTDCVLVFNPETNKYELQLLGLDIQVTPVLKSRLRSQSSLSNTANQSSSSNNHVADPTHHGVFLRERPASSRTSSKCTSPVRSASPVKSTSPVKNTSPVMSANLPNNMNAPVKSNPVSTSPVKNASIPIKATSAALAPRRQTKARLPTRKKIVSKPKLKVDSSKSVTSPPESRATTPDITKASRTSSTESTSSAPIMKPRPIPHARSPENNAYNSATVINIPTAASNPEAPKPEPKSVVTSTVNPLSSEQSDQNTDGFDDSFSNLADELADELGEDDDDNDDDKDSNNNNSNNGNEIKSTETSPRTTWSAGTAGVVHDEDDPSSEEE